MIDQVDEGLRAWVQTILPGADVHFEPPSGTPPAHGVTLYLLHLMPRPPARGTTRPPLQVTLCYLVTTWAAELAETHRLLGELVFAAMSRPDVEVDLAPLEGSEWAAFGTPPRPSFLLRVPMRKDQEQPPTKYVRGPLVVSTTTVASLYGRVVGPGDLPIPDALVELPSLELSERTDTRGYFRFATIPADPAAVVLRVVAKGREVSVPVQRPTSPGEPFLIHLELSGD
jgi:hypothetical protein